MTDLPVLNAYQRANVLRWCEVLETTTHPQTKGHLRTDEGYCCLGIAEEAVGRCEWLRESGTNAFAATHRGAFGIEGNSTVLTEHTRDLLGFIMNSPDLPMEAWADVNPTVKASIDLVAASDQMLSSDQPAIPQFPTLAALNDNGATFKEIAGLVRKWILGEVPTTGSPA